MIILLFGKSIVFWLGLIILIFLLIQLYLGGAMVKGNIGLLKYHKINAVILFLIIVINFILGLL
jgi:hypothetical protein